MSMGSRQGHTSKEKHANHLDRSTGPPRASRFMISHSRNTWAFILGSTAASAVLVKPQPRIRRNLPWSESELEKDQQRPEEWYMADTIEDLPYSERISV